MFFGRQVLRIFLLLLFFVSHGYAHNFSPPSTMSPTVTNSYQKQCGFTSSSSFPIIVITKPTLEELAQACGDRTRSAFQQANPSLTYCFAIGPFDTVNAKFGYNDKSVSSGACSVAQATSATVQATLSPQQTCSAGYTLNGSQCLLTTASLADCGVDHHNISGTCIHNSVCTNGQVVSTGLFPGANGGKSSDPLRTACSGGCETSFSGGMKGRTLQNGTYSYYFEGNYAQTGQQCTAGNLADNTPVSSLPSPTCDVGQKAGTINGQVHCFSNVDGKEVNPNTGQSSGDTTTTRQTTGLPSGVAERETTTRPDGSRTEVDRDSNGKEVARRDLGSDPLKPFCEQNPSSPMCSKTSFGGSCLAGFTCSGDATQCAIAQELYTRDCILFSNETTESTLGRAAVAGTDSGTTNSPAALANRVTTNISSFDQSTFISAGVLTDQTYTFGTFSGHTFSLTVPFSNLFSVLNWMGYAAVSLTLLWAARFVLS